MITPRTLVLLTFPAPRILHPAFYTCPLVVPGPDTWTQPSDAARLQLTYTLVQAANAFPFQRFEETINKPGVYRFVYRLRL